jgi:hypothetical protein
MGVKRVSSRPVTPVREGQEVGEVAAADVVGMLLGHLLDVDSAHVAEQHHRLLRGPVPDHAHVVLLLDLGARVHQHSARLVAVDLEPEDVRGVGGRLLLGLGELHAARLHAPSGEHLGLDHRRPADLLGDPPGLLGALREPVLGHRNAGVLHDPAGFEFKEPQDGRGY